MPASGNDAPRPRQGPPVDNGPTFQESLAEAEHRGLDFPAAERATYVRAMVTRVREMQAAGRSLPQIQELLPEFVRDYPQLFKLLTDEENPDMSSLNVMLAMLERMGRGDMTHHQASVVVGQRLLAKFSDKNQRR